MRDRNAHWESNFAKLCILRDACQDSRTALYVLAYLIAPLEDHKLDEVIAATREFQRETAELVPVESVHDPRD